MLELKDALLEMEGRRIFPRVSMIAFDGQLTCITGASGSGKTALFRVMQGFQPLTEGVVAIDGELLTPFSAPSFRQLMACLPQRVEPVEVSFQPQTDDLECVWDLCPVSRRSVRQLLAAVREAQETQAVDWLRDAPIVLADDPEPALAGPLKSLADKGRTVIVLTCRQEFLSIADKIVTLDEHEHINP